LAFRYSPGECHARRVAPKQQYPSKASWQRKHWLRPRFALCDNRCNFSTREVKLGLACGADQKLTTKEIFLMQKKIIALAIAGLASTAAFAQTNVTIYGVADATFDSVRATGSTGNSDRLDYNNRNRVTANSSYIGFKGVEDLGNGLKAVFQFENGLNTDNSAAGAWNNRDSFVGLTGGFGTLVAGNLTGPTRAMGAKFDVNTGATGIGANSALLAKFGGGAGAGAFDQRITNAIAYVSPTVAGFNGVIGYSTGLTNAFGTTTNILKGHEAMGADASAQGNTAWTLGLNYTIAGVDAGYAYTAVKAAGNGSLADDGLVAGVRKLDDHRIGVMYKAAFGQVGLLWDRARMDLTVGDDIKQNVVYLSGKFNVGKGAVLAQWGHANDLSGQPGLEKTGANHYVLGYEHNLSKRTVLKAIYSRINNKDNANYDFLYGVSQSASTATAGGVNDGAAVQGFSFGVRHAF
jgi:predicted porin